MDEEEPCWEPEITNRIVGLTYYFICKAIEDVPVDNPRHIFLFVYKMSIEYEYNKAMYYLIARSQGKWPEDIDYSDPSCLV